MLCFLERNQIRKVRNPHEYWHTTPLIYITFRSPLLFGGMLKGLKWNEEAALIWSHPWDVFIDLLRNTAVTACVELV